MNWRIARRMSAAVAILVIVIVGAGVAFLHLPALEEARSRVVANLLSSYLGEAVVVNGGVDVTFGRTIDLIVQGVSPAAAAPGAPTPTPPVGTLRMSFSRDTALRGRLDLRALDLSSLRLIIDATEPSTETLGRSISNAVEGVLSSPLVRSLKLKDVSILRINDPAGWNGSLFFDTVTSHATDRTGTVSVEAKGSLKFGVPDLARLASALGRKASAGIQVAFDGTLGAAEGTATVRGSASVGKTDLEGRLRIAAPEGKPEIKGKISAKDLHLDDLTAAREVSELFSDRKIDAVRLRKDVRKETALSLDIAANAVEGGRETAGGLKASLVLREVPPAGLAGRARVSGRKHRG